MPGHAWFCERDMGAGFPVPVEWSNRYPATNRFWTLSMWQIFHPACMASWKSLKNLGLCVRLFEAWAGGVISGLPESRGMDRAEWAVR